MAISVVVRRKLREPIPPDVQSFELRDATARVLGRQPESTLASGIQEYTDAVFNASQVIRLLQEFRFLGQQSDHATRRDLEDAASFIEREIAATVGNGFVFFIGD